MLHGRAKTRRKTDKDRAPDDRTAVAAEIESATSPHTRRRVHATRLGRASYVVTPLCPSLSTTTMSLMYGKEKDAEYEIGEQRVSLTRLPQGF